MHQSTFHIDGLSFSHNLTYFNSNVDCHLHVQKFNFIGLKKLYSFIFKI